jgi:hypothetical protein
MYQTIQKKRSESLASPFDRLLENTFDEQAWYEIFDDRLKTQICTVIIRESVFMSRSENYRYIAYRRQNLAYC